MTGFPLWNFPAFDHAREWLRREGYAVVCPAELDRELGFDEHDERREAWTPELSEEASRRDLRAISHVDAVAVLAGFTKSKGSRVELMAARWIGLPIVAAFEPECDLTDDVDEWLRSERLSDVLREFEGLTVRAPRVVLERPDEAMRGFSLATDQLRVEEALSLVGIRSETEEPDELELVSPRRAMLDEAANLVDGDRNVSYGDPSADFRRTASLWSTYLDGKTELDPHDVAAMMALLKLSRLRWSPEKRDSWVDLAGYAACGLSTVPEAWQT